MKTPLNVRAFGGLQLSETERGYLRVRLGKKLGKFSPHVERVTVRFEDLNGPKGGVDIECRIKVVLSGLPSVVVSENAETVPLAFNQAADRCVRVVRKTLESSGTRAPKVSARATSAKAVSKARKKRPASKARAAITSVTGGGLIGRREGQSRRNVKAAADRPEKRRGTFPVDTSKPGVSATDRKVGEGATATRNTKVNAPKATYALEDSQQPRPSRKSTRKSAHSVKADAPLRTRAIAEARSPETRAVRAQARKR